MHIVVKIALLLIILPSITKAQKAISHDSVVSKKHKSLAVDLLQGRYNCAVAFTTESYWQSNLLHYDVLAEKNGVHYKGTISSKRSKNGRWSAPRLKLDKADATRTKNVIDFLKESGLWQINQDSLNSVFKLEKDGKVWKYSITDGINYRFELITPTRVSMVEAYAPEYSIEKQMAVQSRGKFVSVRNQFLILIKNLRP